MAPRPLYVRAVRTGACLASLLVPGGTADAAAAQSCFQRPTPNCDGFGIVQAGLGLHLGGIALRNPNLRSEGGVLSLTAGYLFNLDGRHAVGPAVFGGANENDGWVGLQARYRRWMGSGRSLEVGLGVAGTGRSLPSPMLFGEAGINVGDRFGLFFQLQTVGTRAWFDADDRSSWNDTRLAPAITARMGGKVAATAALIGGALFGLAWATLS